MRKLFLGAAAAAMIAGSSVAQAAPVAEFRSGSPAAEAEGLVMGPEILLGVFAAILLALALIGINSKDDELPRSP